MRRAVAPACCNHERLWLWVPASAGTTIGSIPKPHIAHEIIVLAPVGAYRVGGKILVGIAHRDAGHDGLVLRDVGDLAHDVGAHDALAVDDAAEPAVPGGEHDAVAQ